jgi:hypothetical protein
MITADLARGKPVVTAGAPGSGLAAVSGDRAPLLVLECGRNWWRALTVVEALRRRQGRHVAG